MRQRTDEQPSYLPQRYQPPALAQARPDLPRFDFSDEPAFSIAEYVQILLRHRWLIAAVAVTVVMLAALQVFTTTPRFRAAATLQIDPEDSKVLPYEAITQSGGQGRQEEYLWTQAEKLRTRSLAIRVVERLDLANDPAFTRPARAGFLLDLLGKTTGTLRGLFKRRRVEAPPDLSAADNALAGGVIGGLQVRPLRNTRLIKVSYESTDPHLAAKICNTLAEEFIEYHLESKFNATVRASDFLHKQLEDLKIRVEKSEEALLRYAQAKNIVNLDERQPISQKKLGDVNDELTRLEADLVAKTVRYDAVRAAGSDAFPEILKNPTILDLEGRLGALEEELAGISGRYGPEWPKVKELRLKLAELEVQLGDEKRQSIAAVGSEYRLARARFDRLSGVMEKQRQVVDRLNEDSIQYRILKREVESNKELYEGLLQRLKEAGVAAGLRSSNIRVADSAVVPSVASAPNKRRALMLALVLGLALGGGLAFVAEFFDNTLKSTEDVTTYLGLPALGVIPSLGSSGNGKRGHGKLHGTRLAAWLGSSAGNGDVRRPVLVHHGPEALRGQAWEAYRSLRTSLLLSHSEKPPQIILVTSALPSEGKTTTVANTAIALAQTGERTLVVDLDMRKPTLAKTFGITAAEGMSTYLSGNSDLASQIRESGLPNLYVLGAGPQAPNPPELLGSPRMGKGLELLREYFKYIVIDTSPALGLSDALILAARGVDGVILVARGGKTPHPALRKAGEHLSRVGARILGVLLNDVDLRQTAYGYGYYGRNYEGYFSPGEDSAMEDGEFRAEGGPEDTSSL